jgi:FkbM family methyltransferase
MLRIKHYDLRAVQKQVKEWQPLREGWKHAAYGGASALHFRSVKHVEKAKKVHVSTAPAINESRFELCVELSILEAIKRPDIVFVEMGAGWGGQTLNVTTAVRSQVVDMAARDVYSYAIEAEPGHYGFLCETFLENKIKGLPIFGAIADTVGWVNFYAVHPSADNYGQSIHPKGNIKVPCFTLENLVETFKIDHIDFVHMDIQGVEPEAIKGSLGIINRIDYLLVCPHYGGHMEQITKMLNPTHNLILAHDARSGYHEVEGFDLPVHQPQDGIMVWERHGLE